MSENFTYIPGSNTDQTLVHKGVVVSVPETLTGYDPIKCRIQIADGKIYDTKDLPDCYPLLPKHLNVYPKVGEYVYILMLNKNSNQQLRYFLGPVIDTFKNLPFNPTDNTETNSVVKSELKQPEKGIYPKREHISIQGRDNSDIVFKNQEVLIRSGKYVKENPLKFNSLDAAYIQVKYGQPELKETSKLVTKQEVKLFTFNGFATATLIESSNVWLVHISIEDKSNQFIGKIDRNFLTENYALSFIKETFLNLQKIDQPTINTIVDNAGNKINNIYDFSRFKYINTGIIELKNFDINPKTEKIQKSENVKLTETIFNESKGSATNIVSNKINLISHGNKEGFKLLDPEQYITPEEQIKINSSSHPIPYGDSLNDFLNLMKSFVANHVHPYPGLPPDPDPIVKKILEYDLETILNQNVRTA